MTANDEPCMCGTQFTCMTEVHWVCDNCGADLRICDCDES